jgi:hypothetical protein
VIEPSSHQRLPGTPSTSASQLAPSVLWTAPSKPLPSETGPNTTAAAPSPHHAESGSVGRKTRAIAEE